MLQYHRIDMSLVIDVNETKESSRCIISNYYCFLEVNHRFQLKVCNGCYDVMQKAVNINNVQVTVTLPEPAIT